MENKMTLRNWFALIGLTCSAFIFNTSEFIPIGLLTDIASDFSVSEAEAGMIISVYAFIVMLLSLPLMILTSRFELKKLILCVISLFVVFQFISSNSTSYTMLMFSRIGIACAHSIFWSIVSPLAVRVVPDKFRDLALSMIVTGTSVAMIFGLPIGRVIGLYIGWRMTFFYIGIFALILLLYIALTVPKVPSSGGFSISRLPSLLKNPLLMGYFILSLAIATSYYTGYSYIEPFLKQIACLQDNVITITLVIFGAMGILGSFIFSTFYTKNHYRFTSAVLIVIFLCLLLLNVSSYSKIAVIVLCAFWGMSFTASNVVLQAETINNSPVYAVPISMAIFSGLFNFGIAGGTFIGGTVCEYLSISYIGYAGSILALLTFLYWRINVMKLLKKKNNQY